MRYGEVERINSDRNVQISGLGFNFWIERNRMLKSLKAVWRNPGDSVQVLRGDKLIFSNTGSFHYQTKTLVLKLQHAPGPQEDLSEHTSWSFALRVSESECLEQRPSNCTFSSFSDDVDGAG